MALTGPSLYVTHGRSSGPSLTAGCVVPSAQAVLRPPPIPTRLASLSRLITGYRKRRSDRTPSKGTTGPGRVSQVPAATLSTFRAPYAGRSLGAALQALHPFHGLRRDNRGSAPPVPARRRRPNDAAGFASRYGPLSRSPQGAFDAGLRPGPFPDQAASLLPGLLAATRTGLAPAGDNELMSDQVKSTNHLQLPGARCFGRSASALSTTDRACQR